MEKITKLQCKIVDTENYEAGGTKEFEITNPFGRWGSHNTPEDIMILKWGGSSGATYIFKHLHESDASKYLKPKNKVTISAKCGQKAEFELDDIDSDQEIDEVTIRGVKYVKE